MLSVKFIRENTEEIKRILKNRNEDFGPSIDELIKINEQRRELSTALDGMKEKRNAASKEIAVLKKTGKDTTKIMEEMKKLSDEISEKDTNLTHLEDRENEILKKIPNITAKDVPVGKDENENVEIRKIGESRKFDFEIKPHWELGKELDILDNQRAAKVTGSRFYFYKGLGAKLERAIINFFLDVHTKRGYKEILPPYLVNQDSMFGTGQLPKFAEDFFKIENSNYSLIPTAEVPVTNFYKDEILNANELPVKFCAYSACFRAEAGAAGRDTRGLVRLHQFNKVELVKFTKPEDSFDELEKLTQDAEEVLKLLKLPYREIELCTGDLGFSSAKTYDLEVWMPSYGRYVEISSCSNFLDFQARRAKIRFKEAGGKAQYLHTLNGSGLAVGRTFAAILENYQNQDGSVNVPEVLKPFMQVDVIR